MANTKGQVPIEGKPNPQYKEIIKKTMDNYKSGLNKRNAYSKAVKESKGKS